MLSNEHDEYKYQMESYIYNQLFIPMYWDIGQLSGYASATREPSKIGANEEQYEKPHNIESTASYNLSQNHSRRRKTKQKTGLSRL